MAFAGTSPHKPPSRGMQASSSRFAPMSSARTPTRAGFQGMLGSKLLARKSICHSPPRRHAQSRVNICSSQHRWWVRRPTTSERSDWRGAAYPTAGRAQPGISQKLESDPNKKPAKRAQPVMCAGGCATSATAATPARSPKWLHKLPLQGSCSYPTSSNKNAALPMLPRHTRSGATPATAEAPTSALLG